MKRTVGTVVTGVFLGLIFGSFAFYHSEFHDELPRLPSHYEEPWRSHFEGRLHSWWLVGAIVWVLLVALLRRLEPLRARSWRGWLSVIIASSCVLALFDFIPEHERNFAGVVQVLVPGEVGLVWALLPPRVGVLWRGYLLVLFMGLLAAGSQLAGVDGGRVLTSTIGLSVTLAPTMWALVHFEPRLQGSAWAMACAAGVLVISAIVYALFRAEAWYGGNYTDQTQWTCALAPLLGVWLAKPTLQSSRRAPSA